MLSKNMIYQINNFSLDNQKLMLYETIFHNANGYIGIRSNFEEGYPDNYQSIRGAYINGFYDLTPVAQAENLYGLTHEKQTMLNIHDVQEIQLMVGGEKFSMFSGTVLKSMRRLDMKKGITERSVLWRSPQGKTVKIDITRMTSFALLPLFTIEYHVRSIDFSGEVKLRSSHIGKAMNYYSTNDPRVAGDHIQHLVPDEAFFADKNTSVILSHTLHSNLSVTTVVRNVLSRKSRIKNRLYENSAAQDFLLKLDKGEEVVLIKYAVFCDSIRYPDCRKKAQKIMNKATASPVKKWYYLQERYLKQFWDTGAVVIKGNEKLSNAITYGLYQLIQSVGKDPYSNVPAKGLSGEGYEGHYFWDTEMYVEPYFLLTHTEIARNLILYRYRTLKEARENARILGHGKGVLYPWRTITGKECSGYFPSGSAQYHINGDIAYSVINYYLVTRDLGFMADYGAEILFETARLWINIGSYYQGSFRICCVTGPDEYTCLVNNNYYTNVLAKHNLKWAAKIYDILKKNEKIAPVAEKIHITESEIQEFREASQHMYLPYNEKLDINPQDDSFLMKKKWPFSKNDFKEYPLLMHYHPLCLYRHQICKQADTVLAHFILEDEQKFSTMKHSFQYYEKITTHDSSLSSCIFCIMASRFGMSEKAYQYFGNSAELDLKNLQGNTKDGIHVANFGGVYMAVVFGFAGLRIKEDGFHLAPALPKEWKGYEFKLRNAGGLFDLMVTDKSVNIKVLSGIPQKIFVYNKPYLLKKSLQVPLRTGAVTE